MDVHTCTQESQQCPRVLEVDDQGLQVAKTSKMLMRLIDDTTLMHLSGKGLR